MLIADWRADYSTSSFSHRRHFNVEKLCALYDGRPAIGEFFKVEIDHICEARQRGGERATTQQDKEAVRFVVAELSVSSRSRERQYQRQRERDWQPSRGTDTAGTHFKGAGAM